MADVAFSGLVGTLSSPADGDLLAATDVSDTSADAAGTTKKFLLSALKTYVQVGVQPLDADLTAIAGLTSAANKVPYFTGSGTAAVADFTAAGRALVDDADAAAQRATLGLETTTTDNAVSRYDSTAGETQNSTVIIGDNGELSGFRANTNAQTGTTYEIVAADDGKVLTFANASAITVTVDDALPAGFVCSWVQKGAGLVSFAEDTGTTLQNRSGHSDSAGQWAMGTLYCDSNSDDSSAVVVLAGDTA